MTRGLLSLLSLLLLAAVRGEHVITLDDDTFDEQTGTGLWMLEFYAPWCGHCKALAPVYEQAASHLASKPLKFAKIDATANSMLTGRYDVKGYPRLMWRMEGAEPVLYKGARDVAGFADWSRRMLERPVATVASEGQMSALLQHNDVAFVLGHSADDAVLLEGFSRVATRLRADFTFGAGSAAALLQIPGFKSLKTPFIAKIQAGEPPIFFTLPEAARLEEEFASWVTQEQFPMLTELGSSNFKTFTSIPGRLAAVMLTDPAKKDDHRSAVEQIKKYARIGGSPLPKEVRESFLYGVLDGAKWAKFLDQYSVVTEELPQLIVLDSVNKQFYRDERIPLTDAHKLLSGVTSGVVWAQTEGVFGLPSRIFWQLRDYPKEAVYFAFGLVVLVVVGVLVWLLKFVCAEVLGGEEDYQYDKTE